MPTPRLSNTGSNWYRRLIAPSGKKKPRWQHTVHESTLILLATVAAGDVIFGAPLKHLFVLSLEVLKGRSRILSQCAMSIICAAAAGRLYRNPCRERPCDRWHFLRSYSFSLFINPHILLVLALLPLGYSLLRIIDNTLYTRSHCLRSLWLLSGVNISADAIASKEGGCLMYTLQNSPIFLNVNRGRMIKNGRFLGMLRYLIERLVRQA